MLLSRTWLLTRAGAPLTGAAAVGLILAGCSMPGSSTGSSGGGGAAGQPGSAAQIAANHGSPPSVTITPADGTSGVRIDAPVSVKIDSGVIDGVDVHTQADPTALPGKFASADDWSLSSPLDPSTTYVVDATAHSASGEVTRATASFTTMAVQVRLTTSASPADGDTVGIGMPVVLRFDHSIAADRQADLISHVQVVSNPPQPGAWHWFAPDEVHYRPQDFWQPGTKVTVNANLRGVSAGNNVYGLGNWSETFTIGAKHVSIINAKTHTMQVFASDKLVNTYPVSTGAEPRFPTLSGTLFVWYKLQDVRMQSQSIGICNTCPGGYDEHVYWDTAISEDGFFIHAAPWSVWAQGSQNVSHGCVNLSTQRAIDFYHFSQVGDVVQVSGTSRTADASDGEGDWQIPFAQYANSGGVTSGPGSSAPAGL